MDVPDAVPNRARGQDTQRTHQTRLVALVFTDLVDSVVLRRQLGDQAATTLLQAHRQIVRELLQRATDAEEVETAGDSFLLLFARPSDAVKFALFLEQQTGALAKERKAALAVRIGVHVGEVVIEEHVQGPKPKDLYGSQIDLCARVMSLAQGGQILLTRAVFDSARQALKGEELHGLNELQWHDHGPYVLKGIEEPVDICEVGEVGMGVLKAPADSDKAQRKVSAEEESVLGWRPAVGQVIPHTRWVLEKKLGEGGFGEVWLGRNSTTKQLRVFKFCFQAERVRFLKREMTLFRVLKERVGDHPNIVRLNDVYLDQPPFYVEMEYVEGADLRSWCEEHGGIQAIALETRFEIVAQAAEGLQAAHEAGIIHRDIKPANILLSGVAASWRSPQTSSAKSPPSGRSEATLEPARPPANTSSPLRLQVKLTDFGIGQVVSEESLRGITRAGFTQTILSDSSSSQTGTQLYLAPELLAGKPASTRSDIYSLGVVLYELLIADFTQPVTGDWATEIQDPLLREDLQHCLAGRPQDRFAGADQLAKHLRALPERRAQLARREAEKAALERAAYRRGVIRTAGVAAVIVIAVGALAWYARQQAREAQRLAIREAQQRQQAQEAARVLRRNVYVSDMNVAHDALAEHNLWLASSLVRKHFPKPGEKEEDLRGFEWRYLWNLCRGDETFTFTNHNHITTCAVFSPDSRTLVTASLDKTINVYDVASKKRLATFAGSSFARHSVAFSLDGRSLVAANDGALTVWDTQDWLKPPLRLASDTASLSWAFSLPVTFSPDGRTLATGGPGGVRFWDVAAWERKGGFGARGARPVTALGYSRDGKLLAILDDEQIELWDIASATQVPGSPIQFQYGAGVKLSGMVLAAGSYDGDVLLWDLMMHRIIKRWKPNKTLAFGLDLSPDGRTLATGGADQLIHLWDVATQDKLATLQGHLNEFWSISFSPDGRMLASGNKDGTVKLWSTTVKRNANSLTNARTPLWFSADGRTLIAADAKNDLQFWKLPAGRLLRTVHIPAAAPNTLILRPGISLDGQRTAVTTTNGSVEVWNLQEGRRTASYTLDDTNGGRATFSADGRLLAAYGFQHATTKVWDTTTGQEIARFPHTHRDLAFSPDGSLLAGSSDTEYAIKIWNLSTKQELPTLRGHKWFILQLAFSPNGKLLISGAIDNTARVWDIASGRQLFVLQGHQSGVHTVAISPDGRTIATGSTDETVKLWNVATGQQLLTLREFKEDLGQVLFSGDGTLLAAGTALKGSLKPVTLWPAPSFAEIDRKELTNLPRGEEVNR